MRRTRLLGIAAALSLTASSAESQQRSWPIQGDANVGVAFATERAGGVSPAFGLLVRVPAHTRWSAFADTQVRETFTGERGPILVGSLGIARRLRENVHLQTLIGRLGKADYYGLSLRVVGQDPNGEPASPRMGLETRIGVLTGGGWIGWFTLFVAGPFGGAAREGEG
jgi:hypothetical protein